MWSLLKSDSSITKWHFETDFWYFRLLWLNKFGIQFQNGGTLKQILGSFTLGKGCSSLRQILDNVFKYDSKKMVLRFQNGVNLKQIFYNFVKFDREKWFENFVNNGLWIVNFQYGGSLKQIVDIFVKFDCKFLIWRRFQTDFP